MGGPKSFTLELARCVRKLILADSKQQAPEAWVCFSSTPPNPVSITTAPCHYETVRLG